LFFAGDITPLLYLPSSSCIPSPCEDCVSFSTLTVCRFLLCSGTDVWKILFRKLVLLFSSLPFDERCTKVCQLLTRAREFAPSLHRRSPPPLTIRCERIGYSFFPFYAVISDSHFADFVLLSLSTAQSFLFLTLMTQVKILPYIPPTLNATLFVPLKRAFNPRFTIALYPPGSLSFFSRFCFMCVPESLYPPPPSSPNFDASCRTMGRTPAKVRIRYPHPIVMSFVFRVNPDWDFSYSGRLVYPFPPSCCPVLIQ